ncbi:MAG TPA: YciI family protein [Marmoricola sp.]|nr:YciI family protein [Marmoricola sp.]
MTHYLMAVIHDWDNMGLTEDEMQESFRKTEAFNNDLRESGHWVFAGGLTHPSGATVVDGRQGQNLVTDGPYAEVKEQLGGFWVIEAADLDEALAVGRRASEACMHPVEIRPFEGVVG